ncbi:hypothetical protein [Ponticaulis profundi]|uniref:Uncharacterized protein n=1 Tax=Ponticaulis profundi TaxID=2665222 RepID=A0ABW1S9E1_9PROT
MIWQHWKFFAGAGAMLALFFCVWLYGEGRSNEAREKAETACEADSLTRDAAAAQARDKQIADIRAEEERKRKELDAQLKARNEIITEQDRAIAKANARARKAARDAQNKALQDRADSGASCPLTGSVRDGYINDVSAYNADNGH